MTFSVALPVMIRAPWQWAFTKCAIECMREGTSIPFQLVIVETESDLCGSLGADTYIRVPQRRGKMGVTKDYNEAIDACTGDFVVHTANDIFVMPGWLEALAKPFELYKDCGVSTIAITEAHGQMDQPTQPVIVEGMYGPLMMFRKGWRLDETMQWGVDSDLVMQIYTAGYRSYRNLSARAYHINRATWDTSMKTEVPELELEGRQKFHEKWGSSPLWMAKMIQNGLVAFGHEHEAVRLR